MKQVTTSPAVTYTRTAVALHWFIALLIGIALPLGFYMHDLPLSPTKLRCYSYHKWLGISVLLLAALRLAWRMRHRPPQLPTTMPRLQRATVAAGHGLLYLLIFVVPVSGWLMSSAKGFQTVWLGIVPLPDLLEKDKQLGNVLSLIHTNLNLVLATLVGGHIVAALRHHFIVKDDVLSRMLFCRRKLSTAQEDGLQHGQAR